MARGTLQISETRGRFTISSTSPSIKEVFWGWAGGRRGMHLYGQETGPWRGDHTRWEWKLSRSQVQNFVNDIALGFAKGYYETAAEKRDAKYVMRRLIESAGL